MKKLFNNLKRTTLLTVGASIFATSSIFAVNIGDTGVSISGYGRWLLDINTPQIANGRKQNLDAVWNTRVRYTIGGKHMLEALNSNIIWGVNQSFQTNQTASLDRLLYVGLDNETYGKVLLGKVDTFMENGLLTDGLVDGGLFGDNGGYVLRYPTAIKYTAPKDVFGLEGLKVGLLFAFNPTGDAQSNGESTINDGNKITITQGTKHKTTDRYPLGYELNLAYANAEMGLDLGAGFAASNNNAGFKPIANSIFNNNRNVKVETASKPTYTKNADYTKSVKIVDGNTTEETAAKIKEVFVVTENSANGVLLNTVEEEKTIYTTQTITTTSYVGGFQSTSALKLGYDKDGITFGLRYAYKYASIITSKNEVFSTTVDETKSTKKITTPSTNKDTKDTVVMVTSLGMGDITTTTDHSKTTTTLAREAYKYNVYGIYAGYTMGDHAFSASFEYTPSYLKYSNNKTTLIETKMGVVGVEYDYTITKGLVWGTSVAQKFIGMINNEGIDGTQGKIENTNPGTKNITNIQTFLKYSF